MNEVKAKHFYSTNEYIKKNPTLHQEDSLWKIDKIIPLVDIFVKDISRKEIRILDVGGGAGLILSAVASHITRKGKDVTKYALDLSPEMLKRLEKNNPDLAKSLIEDITKTSLKNKEVDLALMIDVLEHIPRPEIALNELRRISRYTIFKVPLEDNLGAHMNRFGRGKLRREIIDRFGHVNFYNYRKLIKQIETCHGQVISLAFTNFFDYFWNNPEHASRLHWNGKVLNPIKKMVFNISPRLAAYVFFDFIMVLSKSYVS